METPMKFYVSSIHLHVIIFAFFKCFVTTIALTKMRHEWLNTLKKNCYLSPTLFFYGIMEKNATWYAIRLTHGDMRYPGFMVWNLLPKTVEERVSTSTCSTECYFKAILVFNRPSILVCSWELEARHWETFSNLKLPQRYKIVILIHLSKITSLAKDFWNQKPKEKKTNCSPTRQTTIFYSSVTELKTGPISMKFCAI